MDRLEYPLNANERYMYNICIRLDAIINILSSMVDTYAHQNNIAVEENAIQQEVPKPKRTKK